MRSVAFGTARGGRPVVFFFALAGVLLLVCAGVAIAEGKDETSSPVNGRSLSDPESILSADVLARAGLLMDFRPLLVDDMLTWADANAPRSILASGLSDSGFSEFDLGILRVHVDAFRQRSPFREPGQG